MEARQSLTDWTEQTAQQLGISYVEMLDLALRTYRECAENCANDRIEDRDEMCHAVGIANADEEWKRGFTDVYNGSALSRFIALQIEKHNLDAQLKSVRGELSTLEPAVKDVFVEGGIKRHTAQGVTLFIHRQLRANAPAVEGLRTAFEEAGLGDLVQDRVNANTLSAWLRERAREESEGEVSETDDPNLLVPPNLRNYVNVTQEVSIRAKKE